jgi:hypothetical protein
VPGLDFLVIEILSNQAAVLVPTSQENPGSFRGFHGFRWVHPPDNMIAALHATLSRKEMDMKKGFCFARLMLDTALALPKRW